ncbi:hypothetical protein [Sphingobium sp. Z007]|uniref:hypothetical protein n=1 Tax=Sphingobium sp. Z007 TaxID=627495 RepID=UPI001124D39F|nr:hypothetical protein [Sphingobium sp. Z007]
MPVTPEKEKAAILTPGVETGSQDGGFAIMLRPNDPSLDRRSYVSGTALFLAVQHMGNRRRAQVIPLPVFQSNGPVGL